MTIREIRLSVKRINQQLKITVIKTQISVANSPQFIFNLVS